MKLAPKNFSAMIRNLTAVRASPSRDWLLLLGVWALVLAGSVLWNLWFFDQAVTRGIETPMDASSATSVYEPTAVQEIFAARATTSEAYRTQYPFIDPSR